ncbi:MAG: M48 family metallopeptidase [Candidatus Omnitrophica bacterium]|nr:M48 family metallopeptidase [Candidatus Omnitrophota bacterium]
MNKTAVKPYQLIRSKRRTLALMISADATLVVRAPAHTPLDTIEQFVGKNTDWIKRTLARLQKRPQVKQKQFVRGEEFLFLGESHPLEVQNDTDQPLDLRDGFILNAKEQSRGRELFIEWYKNEAKKIIAARVEWWAQRFCLAYKSVNITCANRRWGSCAPNDRLNFSWRLVMAPISVIDYVVVHELAHITHKNHSRRFWNRVEAMYPDHKDAKTWLRENEGMLNL